MTLLLLVVALLLPWLSQPRDGAARRIERLGGLLQSIEIATRAGAADPWRLVGGRDSEFSALGGLLAQARRQGLPTATSVRAYRRVLRRAAGRERERRRLVDLVRGRASMTVGLAIAARVLLLRSAVAGQGIGEVLVRGAGDPFDQVCLAVAAGGVTIMVFGMRAVLRPPWLGRDGLSAAGLAWLACHIGCGSAIPAVASLRRRELRSGVCLRRERQLALRDLAGRRDDQERQCLRACLEWLPLLEIVGFGLTAALILAAPALAALS